jgi:predicted phage terminase large subunit-like protein
MLFEMGFERVNLPAIAEHEEHVPTGNGQSHHRCVGDVLDPRRESRALLDQIRRDLGPAVFSAQYQQQPIAPEGNLLRMERFGTYDEEFEREDFLKIVQSWDTGMTAAPTSDYSVCTTWGFRPNKWYLLDVFRGRLDYPDLKRAVIRLKRQWQADKVLINDAGSGKSLFQDFRASGPFTPMLWSVTDSKEERFVGCLGEIEAGNILLPVEAPWLDAFRSELRAFPSGRHDDQVDSMTQFIGFQRRNWGWVLTQFLSRGRPMRAMRLRKRPW